MTTMGAAALWTKDPASGVYLAEASTLARWTEDHVGALLTCPVDGAALRFYSTERRGAEVVAWTGECFPAGHAFRVFND